MKVIIEEDYHLVFLNKVMLKVKKWQHTFILFKFIKLKILTLQYHLIYFLAKVIYI